jgi:hypothetical protein
MKMLGPFDDDLCFTNLTFFLIGSLPDSRNTGKNAVAFIAVMVVSASIASTRAVAVMLVASTCTGLLSISTIRVISERSV